MQALWMLLAAFAFACMGVCIKFAAPYFNSAEMTLGRGIVSCLFIWSYARLSGISLATRYPGMHAWRSLVGVLSLMGWFYAITKLPLPTAMTLNYMSSIWIAAFLVGGALLTNNAKNQNSQGPLIITVLLGFAGVVLVLRPAIEHDQMFAGLIGLIASMSAALAYMQVIALSRLGEPEARVVFYFSIATLVAGALATLIAGASPLAHYQSRAIWWLLPIGVMATIGQLCMTRAYASGATLVVANLQYSGIVFAALFSMLLFGEHIPWIGWAGMALIVTSGIAATVLRARALPNAPGEEH